MTVIILYLNTEGADPPTILYYLRWKYIISFKDERLGACFPPVPMYKYPPSDSLNKNSMGLIQGRTKLWHIQPV